MESSGGSKGKNERMRSVWRCGSKEKEKGEDVDKIMYTCVVDKIQEKRKKRGKGNVWRKKRQRIRNHNLKILPQYFHNKF